MITNKIFNNSIQNKDSFSFKAKKENDTIKGVLLNRYIQNRYKQESSDIELISDSLLISPEASKTKQEEENNSGFDFKKAIKPIVVTSGIAIASFAAIGAIISGYSNKLATKDLVVAPDLATNMNILEEPHFALYRALRNPTERNILGFGGVCLFSGLTLAAKSFVDGFCDVWIKKQECDIDYDFKKDMIQVENSVFSGKLDVVNSMLKNTSDYFKSIFSKGKKMPFGDFISFKGSENKTKTKKNDKDNKTTKTILTTTATVAGVAGVCFLMFKNYQKIAKNLGEYTRKHEDFEIQTRIQKAVEDKNIGVLKDILKSINASEEVIRENLSKAGVGQDKLQDAINEVAHAQIYAKPPEALGGVSNKIQYYCYINEERGHLYNWILNPDNPFNKYLFLGFSVLSSLGYIAQKAAESVKKVAVGKENKKSELNLKKNLVAVEIENFKAKKESAINPLVESFKLQMQKGKSEEELKEMAQNVLIEIKQGPPYVYS